MLIAGLDRMSARMHQVSFAESDTTVEIERVVSASRSFSDRKRRSMCKLITGTNDETVVSVF